MNRTRFLVFVALCAILIALQMPMAQANYYIAPNWIPIYQGIEEGCGVYFVHSYHVVPADASVIATTTDYGVEFVSSIWRDNLVATQFHPEKSQAVGLSILTNFAKM